MPQEHKKLLIVTLEQSLFRSVVPSCLSFCKSAKLQRDNTAAGTHAAYRVACYPMHKHSIAPTATKQYLQRNFSIVQCYHNVMSASKSSSRSARTCQMQVTCMLFMRRRDAIKVQRYPGRRSGFPVSARICQRTSSRGNGKIIESHTGRDVTRCRDASGEGTKAFDNRLTFTTK